MSVRVQIEVHGPAALLQLFRSRANALLAAQFEDRFAEHHTADRLEYRLVARHGIPFPPFVTASAECPELLVQVVWQARSGPQNGTATITAGKVVEYKDDGANAAGEGTQHSIEAAADGAITLAVVLRESAASTWIGYMVNAHQQAYFACEADGDAIDLRVTEDVASTWTRRWRIGADGAPAACACGEPIAAATLGKLDELARAFVDAWIWFDAEPELETALERHRFTLYGLRTYPANLRSERIHRAMTRADDGYLHGTLDPTGMRIVAALKRCWPDVSR